MNLETLVRGTAPKKVLLLAKSGAGKTTLLRGCPGPIFVADFDNKGQDILAGIKGELEPYVGSDGWKSWKKKYEEFTTNCPYGTVALDSLSLGSESCILWAKEQNGNRSVRITQEDWGRGITEIKDCLRALTKLPCHVIVTMHFQVEKDEALGGLIWNPAIFGRALPGQIPAFFNDVWLLKVANKLEAGNNVTKRVLQLTPDTRFDMLKNSGNGAWASEEEPDYAKLWTKVNAATQPKEK